MISMTTDNLIIQTGSTYIFKIMIDIIEISALSIRAPPAQKVFPGYCDNDRQPKIALCPSNRKYFIFRNMIELVKRKSASSVC